MSNSARIRLALTQHYPLATSIQEVTGNPNILGDYLFVVDGKQVSVNPEDSTIEKDEVEL